MFDDIYFRFMILLLIAYFGNRNITLSLILSIIYINSIKNINIKNKKYKKYKK